MSIGLPVYNGAQFLARALDSHLAQTFTDFELVITDNCSTDETEQIARSYADKDARISYVRNNENLGASPNFQKAYALTTAPYFRWAAHDDYLAPTFLEKCVAVLDSQPDTALVFTGMTIVRDDESVRRTTIQKVDGIDSASTIKRFHRLIWRLKDATSPVFGLSRRELLDKTGLIRNSTESDRILVAELSLLGGIHEIEELLFYRYLADGHYDRDNWTWLDPKNIGIAKRGTVRVTRHHLNAIAGSDVSAGEKMMLRLDLIVAFAVRRLHFRVRLVYKQRIRKPWRRWRGLEP